MDKIFRYGRSHSRRIFLASIFFAVPQRAFAMQEVQQAILAVKSVHVHVEPSRQGIGNAWALFTDQHQLLRLRMDFPATEDGPKMTIWEKDKATVWFKKKNSVVTLSEKAILDRLPGFFQMIDPGQMIEPVLKAQGDGTPDVKVQQPTEKEKRIVVTKTDRTEQSIFYVNVQTHLVERIDKYDTRVSKPALIARFDYSDYDAVDPAISVPSFPRTRCVSI